MSRFSHGLSDEAFAALAAGGGGPTAIEQLAAAEHSKHLLLLAAVVNEARQAGHEEYPLAAEGYALLSAVDSHDPAAARRVIRHPSTGAWAMRTVRALRGGQCMPGATPGARIKVPGAKSSGTI